MPAQENIPILAIGSCAREILQSDTAASVIGLTSKGVFARTPSEKILFLTQQPYRGPLTVNLPVVPPALLLCAHGTTLRLSPAFVFLPGSKQTFEMTDKTEIFHPPGLHEIPFKYSECAARAALLVGELQPRFNPALRITPDNLRAFSVSLQTGALQDVIAFLTPFLGSGAGLTPSGDDFICGIALALSAWRSTLFPRLALDSLFSQLQPLTIRLTTTLSANLIACAARGAADERLTHCLVWLHTGEGDLQSIKKELLMYGSSSGIETLQGILAVLSARPANGVEN